MSLKRVTDLFNTGRELVLDETAEPPMLLFVRKLNPFERGEAQRDGQAGRARALMMLTDDDDQVKHLRKQMAAMSQDELIQRVLNLRDDEFMMAAIADLRADPEWRNEWVLLDRLDALSRDGAEMSEEEQARYDGLNQRYFKATGELRDQRIEAERHNLHRLPKEDLVDDVIVRFRESKAVPGFLVEYEITSFYFGVRECSAKKNGEKWDHSGCTHQRVFESRSEVREIDAELYEMIRAAMNAQEMSTDEAGN